jgi:hypothetical protein
MTNEVKITWAPRVSRAQILELYRSEAEGRLNEALLDEVFYGIAVRCISIMEVTATCRGQVKCHACSDIMQLPDGCVSGKNKDCEYLLTCPACGWSVTWGTYFRSFHKKQLVAGGSEPYVKEFLANMEHAQTARDKFLSIDRLIHGFHVWWCENRCMPTRCVGINVIAGDQSQIVKLIETLAYENIRDPEIRKNCLEWQERWHNHEIPAAEMQKYGDRLSINEKV